MITIAELRTLTSLLSITWARLRDLTRVVRGVADPGALHAPHNDAAGLSLPGELMLNAWKLQPKAGR